MSCSSSARSIAARSVTSPWTKLISRSSSGVMISSRRWWLVPRSKAVTCAPSRTSVLHVQAPMQPHAPVTRKRSGILVDGHLVGVELQCRASLLVRAEAGPLDAAERNVHVGTGGLRVDVEDARLELVHEPLRRGQSAGEDRRAQAVLDRVRAFDRLVERL